MKMQVVYLDGTKVETVIGPRAQVEVERRYDCLFTEIFEEKSGKARVERFYLAAWAALHFSGDATASDDDFEAWLSRVEDVIPIGKGKARPTKRVRRPVKSSA